MLRGCHGNAGDLSLLHMRITEVHQPRMLLYKLWTQETAVVEERDSVALILYKEVLRQHS